MKAYVKGTDIEIVGTLENLAGCAEISEDSFRLNKKGNIKFEYGGGTEVFWDGQVTVTREGQKIFLTDDGEEYPEDQIELRE